MLKQIHNPDESHGVIGGVDTHKDMHVAAVVTTTGDVLGTEAFSTTRAGYRAMLRWFRSHGAVLRVGVEQTGSFGAELTRHLALAGVPVLEVTYRGIQRVNKARLPDEVEIRLPRLGWTVTLDYRSWRALETVPDVFNLTPPRGATVKDLESALRNLSKDAHLPR